MDRPLRKVYENYIDDVIKIREHGYDIDTWNPNNYLFDKESKRGVYF